jgi:type VI secretion system secreted protein VgrG
MEIKTPLDDGVLLFYSLHASEQLGRLFEYQITVLSRRPDVKAEDILGKNVTVSLELIDGSRRYFDAQVTKFGLTGGLGRYFRYQITGRPWLWLLTRTSDCRIFQKLQAPDIVKEILGKYPEVKFESRLTGEYQPWEYCVQYRETDFNFVSRLMEREGIYYYFKHEPGKHTLVLADTYAAHEAVEGYETFVFLPQAVDTPRQRDEVIEDWIVSKEVQPGAYVIDDYDFERPSVELESQFRDPRQHAESKLEIYDYPGEYRVKNEGEHIARMRLEELLSEHELCEASGTTRALQLGSLFKLTAHPRADQNREYLVTSAQYTMRFEGYEGLEDTGGDYRCSFTCIPSNVQYRPARRTPKPLVQGPQTAVVVGPAGDEIHTDKYGRVKVHFHWDRHGKGNENDTTWIRVSHPWAGKGWGAIAIPRIGQEVIVDFLEGDPDRPIITGRVYNAETMPPFGLPGAGVISGIKSNTHKGRGYNEMTMDDTAGKEKITIHAQYDMGTTVEHDDTQTIHNDRTIKVDGTHTETITKDTKIKIETGYYDHDVAGNKAKYHVSGNIDEKYDANQTTKVGQTITIVSEQANISVKAATKIEIEVGASKITMDSAGKISVTCVNLAMTGSESVNISGKSVTSKADADHNIEGGIVMSKASGNNTVSGGMVLLNP